MTKILKNVWRKLDEYLLYLFVFLLPWQIRWIFVDSSLNGDIFEYGRMSIYLFDIVLVVLLFCYFVIRLLNKGDWGNKNKRSEVGKLIFVFLYFCIFVILSALWAQDKLIVLYWGVRMFMGFSLFYLIQKINFSRVRLAIVVVIAGAIQGLLAAGQFLSQTVWEAKWLGMAGQNAADLGVSVVEFGLVRWLRAYGSLPHPNILGGILVLSFLALIYLVVKINVFTRDKSEEAVKWRQLFILFSVAAIMLGIFFSFSRAAWIGWILALFGGVWMMLKIKDVWVKKFALATMMFSLFLFGIFSVVNWPIVGTRLGLHGGFTRLEAKSNLERLSGYKQADEIIRNNWLLGTGVGNYTFELRDNYPNLKVWDVAAVHNVYWLVLAELGVVGFLIITLLNGYIVKLLIKKKSIFGVLVFVCLSVLILFDHWWWTLASGMYVLWLLGGISLKGAEK